VLKDIWDAQILKKLYNKGKLFNRKDHIGLALSVDGVSVYKFFLITLYPVFIVILNLPPKIRMNAENMILAGLYVGPKKPVMKLLLDPVMKNLKHLLVFGVFDLIAKAPVLILNNLMENLVVPCVYILDCVFQMEHAFINHTGTLNEHMLK